MHNLINQTSFSGSLCEVEDIIEYTKENNLNYAIITEDSSLASSPLFNKRCVEEGIKPIHGAILNIKELGSIVLYAKNQQGFSELSNILSELPKFEMGKKRFIDSDVLIELLKTSKNLLLLDGFEGSILDSEFDDKSRSFYASLANSMGGLNNIYFSYSDSSSELVKLNLKKLMSSKKSTYNQVIKSGISRYIKKDDKIAWQSFYLSKGYGRDKNERNVLTFNNDYSLGNSQKQTDKLNNVDNFSNFFDNYSISRNVEFPNLYGKGDGDRPLREKVRSIWIKKRSMIGDSRLLRKYELRIKEEIEVIESLDKTFEQYILFYESLAKGARSKGFEAFIRGSAGGSLVLWVLGMSKADPIKYNLPFDRFLFKGIEGFPDIDLDVSHRKDFLNMLSEHYTDKFFAKITTTSTIKKATETIDAALSYYKITDDLSQNELDDFSKRMGNLFKYLKKTGDETKVSYLIKNNKFWIKEYQNPISKKIMDDAIRIEDSSTKRSPSVSSSVLSSTPLQTIMPVQDSVVELFSENCEDMGLLKIDIMSSLMLKRINTIKRNIYQKWDKFDENGKKIPVDIYISDHKNVSRLFDYMSKGYTEGVNQITGDIGKFICRDIKPSNISDLMVVLGLIRTGINENMKVFPEEYLKYKEGKENPEKIKYIHDDLRPILKETYGSIIFEEQIMEIAKKIGGFNPNDANAFRKCITKTKDEEKLNTYFKEKFISGSSNNGYSDSDSIKIFEMLAQKINQFNFSKNHSANYAMVALSEMFLKYEYPAEFLDVYSKSVKGVKGEKSISMVNQDFINVGYQYKRPELKMIFSEQPETIDSGQTKLISKSYKELLNSDFVKNHNSEDDVSIDNLVVSAKPFYSSKSSFLISEKEKEKLAEDFKNIIKSGFLDSQYMHLIDGLEKDESSIVRLRYSLCVGLDKIIEYRTDIENNQLLEIDNLVQLCEIPQSLYSGFKMDCTIKESEILGYSPLMDISNKVERSRKPD